MTGDDAYRWLTEGAAPGRDAFDAHVLASVLALAMSEGDLCAGSGLDREAVVALGRLVFPGCVSRLEAMARDDCPEPEVEQDSVRELLIAHRSGVDPLEATLAAMIARRAMEPDHLWQDLGLRDRGELSALLTRHFAPLAVQNRDGMKWKRFFYRKICEDEGFVLCAAPSCSACDDFQMCFGEETGEARLARVRNVTPAHGPV